MSEKIKWVKVLGIMTVIPNGDPTVSHQVHFKRYSSTVEIAEEVLKRAKITIKATDTGGIAG